MRPTLALAAIDAVAQPHRGGHRCHDSKWSVPPRVAQRAAERYEVAASGCWESTCTPIGNGYHKINWRDETGHLRTTTAHRAAWVAHAGPIPLGMEVDHQCLNRACVRPSHLRLLTPQQNAADAGQRRRTSEPVGRLCQKGHPLTQTAGAREASCLTCRAASARGRYAKKKAETR